MYVDERARRSGVFCALWADVRRRAEARGDVRGLRLYVERSNDRARTTYLSLGMHVGRCDLLEFELPT